MSPDIYGPSAKGLVGLGPTPKRLLSKPNPHHRGPCHPELGLALYALGFKATKTKSKKPFASILDTTLPMVKMKKALRQKKKNIIRNFFNKNPTATRMLQSGVGCTWLHTCWQCCGAGTSRSRPFWPEPLKKGRLRLQL